MQIAVLTSPNPAQPHRSNSGSVLQLYNGNASGLQRAENIVLAGPLSSLLSEQKQLLQHVQRVIYVIPESECYWFDIELPFAQRKKIEAVLASQVEDLWPGDVDELEMRFRVLPDTKNPYKIQVCAVAKEFLTTVSTLFAEAEIPFDQAVAASAVFGQDSLMHPLVVLQADDVCIYTVGNEGMKWTTLRLPGELRGGVLATEPMVSADTPASDQTAEEDHSETSENTEEVGHTTDEVDTEVPAFANETVAEYQPIGDKQLSAVGVWQTVERWVANQYRGCGPEQREIPFATNRYFVVNSIGPDVTAGDVRMPLPELPLVSGSRSEYVDSAMSDRVALQAVQGIVFNFGKGRGYSFDFIKDFNIGVGQLIAVAASIVVLLTASLISLSYKNAEAALYREYYREVFTRSFPGQKPTKNVVRQAKALLGESKEVKQDFEGRKILKVLTALSSAAPKNGNVVFSRLERLENTWSLDGTCSDFGCVDALQAGLDKIPYIVDVKLNSAKQTLKKDAVKFSITAKETSKS